MNRLMIYFTWKWNFLNIQQTNGLLGNYYSYIHLLHVKETNFFTYLLNYSNHLPLFWFGESTAVYTVWDLRGSVLSVQVLHRPPIGIEDVLEFPKFWPDLHWYLHKKRQKGKYINLLMVARQRKYKVEKVCNEIYY